LAFSDDRLAASWRKPVEQFLTILTQPDNIPIVGLLVATLFCLYVAMKQAFRHDRLIRAGRRDEIYDEMVK